MNPIIQTKDNYTYGKDALGVLHQLDPKPFVYDPKYVDTYHKPEYKDKSNQLMALRIAFLKGAVKQPIHSLLDVGFGDGSFLDYCEGIVQNRFGTDVTGLDVPRGCKKVELFDQYTYDVVTFWDSLEHFKDIDFLKYLNTKYVAISLPNMCTIEQFETWKHRKPNEHLHFFDYQSLTTFMASQGYAYVTHGYIEDKIRVGELKTQPNILTGVYKKM